jgi:hypothetical protein
MTTPTPETQRKSAILARLMGWETTADDWVIWRREGVTYHIDLYDEANMATAWRVVEWIATPRNINHPVTKLPIGTHFCAWWNNEDLWAWERDEFQTAVLDKVLELAIAAGLVQP